MPVSRATSTSHAGGRVGAGRSLPPPLMNSKPMLLVTFSGRAIVIQCVQSGRSTSFSVSHFCDVISRRVAVTPSAWRSRTIFHEKFGSGAATYRSRAVCAGCARAVAAWGDVGAASGTAVASAANSTDAVSPLDRRYRRYDEEAGDGLNEETLMRADYHRLDRVALGVRFAGRGQLGGSPRIDVPVASESQRSMPLIASRCSRAGSRSSKSSRCAWRVLRR